MKESNPFRHCCGSEPYNDDRPHNTAMTNPQDIIKHIELLWGEIKSLKKDVERLQNKK